MMEDNPKKLLKEIERGKYREYYLIYNRKSTDEPDNQKNSIQYQKAENARFAHKYSLQVAPVTILGFCMDGIVSEKHSGFKENVELVFNDNGAVQYKIARPKFYRMVQFLNKGYFKGIIVLCWDRVSRNKGDTTIIEKLIKKGLDFRFTLASYDKTSSGALHMDIDSMFAEHHSRVTSEKVSLTIKNQRNKGVCTYKAPVGYLNPGSMEHKPFDPERAPLIKKLFELYATGTWTLADLARWANEHGLTMPPVRRRRTQDEILMEEEDDTVLHIDPVSRPVTYTNIHKILTNPFYTGRILNTDGRHVVSRSHEPLVSDELFQKVQESLGLKRVSVHYTKKLDHPYRGFVRCALCSRTYTPYQKKGIMYYGARCRKDCPNTVKSFNRAYLEEKIAEYMQGLSFTEMELQELEARTQTDIASFDRKRLQQVEVLERRKKKLREELSYLRDNKLALLKAGLYTPESYIAEEQSLLKKLTSLQDQEQVSDITMHEVVKDAKKLSELLKNLYGAYKNAKSGEKEEIVRALFSELSFSENTLICKAKKGIDVFANRSVPLGDPMGRLSEKIGTTHYIIKDTIRELTKLLTRGP